jgi:type IV secretion system protein TrbL
MPSACSLPGVGALCGAAGAAVSAAGGSVLDGIAKDLSKGFAEAAKLSLASWTSVGLPDLTGPAEQMHAWLAFATVGLAVISLLVAAGRLMLERKSGGAVVAGRTLVTLLSATFLAVPAVMLLGAAGDEFSAWLLGRAAGHNLGDRLVALAGSMGGLGIGLELIVAILGTLAALAQLVLMVVRVGLLVVLTGVLPTVAAASGTRTGRESFQKLTAWLLAAVLYKPVAAVIYATAFVLLGDGTGPQQILAGLAVAGLALVALPGLMRLMAPAVAAATSQSGGGAMLAAAAAAPTGARILAGRSSSGGGGTGAAGATGKSAQAGKAAQGAAPAAAGAAAAAGPVGVAASAAAKAGTAVKGAAHSAVTDHTSGAGKGNPA